MPSSARSKIRARSIAKSQQLSEEEEEDKNVTINNPYKRQKLHHESESDSDDSEEEKQIVIEDFTHLDDSSEASSTASTPNNDGDLEPHDVKIKEESDSSVLELKDDESQFNAENAAALEAIAKENEASTESVANDSQSSDDSDDNEDEERESTTAYNGLVPTKYIPSFITPQISKKFKSVVGYDDIEPKIMEIMSYLCHFRHTIYDRKSIHPDATTNGYRFPLSTVLSALDRPELKFLGSKFYMEEKKGFLMSGYTTFHQQATLIIQFAMNTFVMFSQQKEKKHTYLLCIIIRILKLLG